MTPAAGETQIFAAQFAPDFADRVGQPLQPVVDQHEDVFDAAVLELREHAKPVFRAFAAVADPQAEDVAVPSAVTARTT